LSHPIHFLGVDGCGYILERLRKIVAYFDLGDISRIGCISGSAVANHSPEAYDVVAKAEVVPAVPDRVGVA